ncbi:hypothetical protein IQ244_30965 [Nostoc sp. LEGE 06077]|nr:hypothetical protein [Nostoc sp. LEGE 06077]
MSIGITASTRYTRSKPKTYAIHSTQSGDSAVNCPKICGCASSNATITPNILPK